MIADRHEHKRINTQTDIVSQYSAPRPARSNNYSRRIKGNAPVLVAEVARDNNRLAVNSRVYNDNLTSLLDKCAERTGTARSKQFTLLAPVQRACVK